MSRERLFKGNRIDNGAWIESGNINTQTDMYGKEHTYMGLYETSKFAPLQRTIYWVEVIPESVREYSGLLDKNGTKIFPEVIVKIKERFEQTKGYTTCYDIVFVLTELAKQYGVEIKE